MSQPVKTRSSRWARGTKSLMSGLRESVRLPRRMVAICEVEPMGLAKPRRIASTPAIRVVATAPMPGIMTPSFPVAGLMLAAACVAAPGVDILDGTLLSCDIPCNADSLVSLTVEEGCKWGGMSDHPQGDVARNSVCATVTEV